LMKFYILINYDLSLRNVIEKISLLFVTDISNANPWQSIVSNYDKYIYIYCCYSVHETEGLKGLVELTTPYFSHACHCAVYNKRCSPRSTHESR